MKSKKDKKEQNGFLSTLGRTFGKTLGIVGAIVVVVGFIDSCSKSTIEASRPDNYNKTTQCIDEAKHDIASKYLTQGSQSESETLLQAS